MPEVSNSFLRLNVTKHTFHVTFFSGKPLEDISGLDVVLTASEMWRKWKAGV